MTDFEPRLADFAEMWGSESGDWYLFAASEGAEVMLPVNNVTGGVRLICDDDLAREVTRRMLAAGVEVRRPATSDSEVTSPWRSAG